MNKKVFIRAIPGALVIIIGLASAGYIASGLSLSIVILGAILLIPAVRMGKDDSST